eukprot:EG_transcript_68619
MPPEPARPAGGRPALAAPLWCAVLRFLTAADTQSFASTCHAWSSADFWHNVRQERWGRYCPALCPGSSQRLAYQAELRVWEASCLCPALAGPHRRVCFS